MPISLSSCFKSYSPFGESNLAIIGEVSIARNNRKIKSEGNQGSLPKAFTLAIKPSKLSIMGCDDVTLDSYSAFNDVICSSAIFTNDFLIFLNATSFGLYLILVKPLISKYSPITVVKWVFTFGLIGVIPFGIYDFNKINWEMSNDVILKINDFESFKNDVSHNSTWSKLETSSYGKALNRQLLGLDQIKTNFASTLARLKNF